MSRFNKFWAALVGAAASIATVAADGEVTKTELIVIVATAITAIGVYAVPNKPPGTP